MKNNIIFLCTLSACIFMSCHKIELTKDASNDPKNNFEIFWNDFDQNYGLFIARCWNWDSIYSAHSPFINENTTDDELWNIMAQCIEYLDDGHTVLIDPINDTSYESGSYLNDLALEEFELNLVNEKYTDGLINASDEIDFFYGKLKGKNIGYIYLESMDGDDPVLIDNVVSALSHQKAIIFDIRNNGGGGDAFSKRIAGAFADRSEVVYTVQEKKGPGHNEFGPKISFSSEPEGNFQYLKPVIVLTDRYTVSAAEVFLLHMNAFDHVTQIGDTTAGDFSDIGMLRFLPNGWVYHYSIMMYLLPNGKSLDGIGHVPDVYIKNTKEDIMNDKDLVLEKAISYLFEHYGIE